MSLHNLDYLYRQTVMEYAQHPHHFKPVTVTDKFQIQQLNPTCGDVIRLAIDIADDKVKNCHFDGEGCAISRASASMMTDLIIGQPIPVIRQLDKLFSQMTMGIENNFELLEEAQLLAGVTKFPARIKCATLPWHALMSLLAQIDE